MLLCYNSWYLQVGDQFGEADKQFYLSLTDHDVQHKVRELNANRIGQLVRISGQVNEAFCILTDT